MKIELVAYFYTIFSILCFESFCQQKNEIGADFQTELISKSFKTIKQGATKTTQSKVIFSPALTYQRQFTNHSSLEIELKYRQVFSNVAVTVSLGSNYDSQLNFLIEEEFLSFPILYKFKSKIITFSIGPTVDFFLGGDIQKPSGNYYTLRKEFYSDKWSWGFLTKVSKPIKLDKKIIFEPGLFYNPILSSKRNYIGISFATKYKL